MLFALMVMPRSRSRSMESSTGLGISRWESAPVIWRRRSASVDLPWSICAMIQKLRMNFGSIYLMTGRALFFELLHAAQIGAVQSFSLPQIALSRKASDLQWQFVSAASSGKQIRYNRKLRRKKNLNDTVPALLLLLSPAPRLRTKTQADERRT